jgi:hypothetical protein
MQSQEIQEMPLQTGPLLSYDNVINLIGDLEDGELEKRCNEGDLERINHFLANLAAQGVLPNEPEEEFILQNDIQELLHGEESPYQYSFSLGQGNDYVIIPGIFYGQEEIVLCKSWIQKKWEQTKKFVKKHKKAIIIGAVVVVATVVVVGVVAAASAAGAAAAGAAASGSDSDKDEKDKLKAKDEQQPTPASTPPADSSHAMSVANEAPILKSVIQERVSNFKETVAEEQLYTSDQSIGHEDAALGEKARNLGAALAHQTLDGISELTSCIPQLLEEIKDIGYRILPESLRHSQDAVEITPIENFNSLIAAGHEKIDQVFSTDQACLYTNEAKETGNQFAIGILPPPGIITKISIDTTKFAEGGKALDKAGFTKAGRGITKHGYREESAFPRPTGNPAQVNEQGQKILESILNHPEKIVYERPHPDFGKVIEVVVPGKWGVRFTTDGEMIGFLEP